MRARLLVFPVKGRSWCFSRSLESSSAAAESASAHTPSGLRELWAKLSSNTDLKHSNVELLIDFASNKMNKAWMGLEKAPEGAFKSRLHGLGLGLLARVKPSEMFLKSINKEVSSVEITYPISLIALTCRTKVATCCKKGSEKLLELLSDSSASNVNEGQHEHNKLKNAIDNHVILPTWNRIPLQGHIPLPLSWRRRI
ncbi:hypothetical protein SAY86_025618 [Trapa natans]|uniref:Uncharacterized protein n=1 Tax=Trapa natans TaxID=22666 RepID=A0AAN7KH65_TRANT|nr:hypothetical protein SAY86_025618 [Trapa natans]